MTQRRLSNAQVPGSAAALALAETACGAERQRKRRNSQRGREAEPETHLLTSMVACHPKSKIQRRAAGPARTRDVPGEIAVGTAQLTTVPPPWLNLWDLAVVRPADEANGCVRARCDRKARSANGVSGPASGLY